MGYIHVNPLFRVRPLIGKRSAGFTYYEFNYGEISRLVRIKDGSEFKKIE